MTSGGIFLLKSTSLSSWQILISGDRDTILMECTLYNLLKLPFRFSISSHSNAIPNTPRKSPCKLIDWNVKFVAGSALRSTDKDIH